MSFLVFIDLIYKKGIKRGSEGAIEQKLIVSKEIVIK